MAVLLLGASLAVQVSVLPCPMAGGAMGGAHHGHGGPHAAPPSGEDVPDAHDGSSAPAAPGGCGALMACGLAAAIAAPAPPGLPLPTPLARMVVGPAPVSAATGPVELPPPRA